jgi:hypothetical protein
VTEEFGKWSISGELYDFIRKVLPRGSTILELGSGYGSSKLAEGYTVYSVEHDDNFMNQYFSTSLNYIYAPLKKHKAVKNHSGDVWYDAKVLGHKLQGLKYDLLLVDGPPESRAGFVKYFEDLFDTSVIIVFDDVNRRRDNKVMNSIAAKLKVPYVTYGAGTEKLFGVVNDPCTR